MAEPQVTRRGFLENLAVLLGLASAPPPMAVAAPKPQEPPPAPTIDHLPRTLAELEALPVQEKLLLAVTTASGSDAVGYYTPDLNGKLTLSEHIDLYPARKTAFAPGIDAYRPDTFANEAAAAANATYHIPVYVTDAAGKSTGILRGVAVLHAPQGDFSRVQSEAEKVTSGDMHEPAIIRMAKLDMASHIMQRHQDMLGGRTQAELARRGMAEARHKTIDEKLDYFTQLARDMFATFTAKPGEQPAQNAAVKNASTPQELISAVRAASGGYDSTQAAHVLGVAEIMNLAIGAVNKDQPVPIVNAKQAQLIELLTLLHDVGKTQMSSNFLKPWVNADPQSKDEQERYGLDRNHNHPLFTTVTLLLDQQEGITAGAHHHGLFRYTTQELEEKFGKGEFASHTILKDNIPATELPILSRLMRVADVGESISRKTEQPMDYTLVELARKAGYDPETKTVKKVEITQGTIDPDCLCFYIDSGVFKAYGEQRNQQGKTPPYDLSTLDATAKDILDAFGWEQRRETVTAQLRQAVADDPLLRQNAPAPALQPTAAPSR
jgi:hypothetical protein